MGTNSPSYGCWSMLLDELLEIILSRLDLADHIRFGAVRKQWRLIAVENTAANKPFCLVRSSDPLRLINRLLRSLTQDLSIRRQWVHARFYLGVKGWLVLRLSYMMIQPELGSLEKRCSLILLNPGSRMSPILLPSLPSWSSPSLRKVVLSSPPDQSSAHKCTIVFMDIKGDMGFCRIGDTDWTMIDTRTGPWFQRGKDMLFYKEQFYAIDMDGLLIVYDSGLNSAPTRCLKFTPWSECFLLVSYDKMLLLHITYANRTFRNPDGESDPHLFRAFEIDLKGIPSYIERKSLGDDTILFVSSRSALCLQAKENSAFRPNHTYNPDNISISYTCLENMVKRTYRKRNPIFFHLCRSAGFRKIDKWKC